MATDLENFTCKLHTPFVAEVTNYLLPSSSQLNVVNGDIQPGVGTPVGCQGPYACARLILRFPCLLRMLTHGKEIL
jgi:hypothetical protein